MSYIGNVPTTAAFPFDQFSGNGSTTAFTLSYAPAGTTSIIVSISGVVQNPNTYSVSGTTLTFTPAPPTGTSNIAVLYLGLPVVASMTGTMGFIAGSATNPSIFPIGDTNTGIFFPAADTIAFSEGGTESMRIDSSGNVGIGTSSPSSKLHVAGGSGSTIRNTASAGSSWFVGSNVDSYILHNESNTPMLFTTNGTEQARLTAAGLFQFNSGYGSVATAYGCRAWVNFNGTGTIAIRGSGNVTSLTDVGTGTYNVNFTAALTDANYSAVGCAGGADPNNGDRQLSTYPTSSSVCRVVSGVTASVTKYDADQVMVAIFR